MELKEALLKRRSIRRFTDKPVPEEYINELLHAAMSGPSACNKTPWEFYVITNEETLLKLRKAARYSNIAAPLAIVVCGNLSKALPPSLLRSGYRIAAPLQKTSFFVQWIWGLEQYGAECIQ